MFPRWVCHRSQDPQQSCLVAYEFGTLIRYGIVERPRVVNYSCKCLRITAESDIRISRITGIDVKFSSCDLDGPHPFIEFETTRRYGCVGVRVSESSQSEERGSGATSGLGREGYVQTPLAQSQDDRFEIPPPVGQFVDRGTGRSGQFATMNHTVPFKFAKAVGDQV